MKSKTTIHWTFNATSLSPDSQSAFDCVVNTLKSHTLGAEYVEGKLNTPDMHEKMQLYLVEKLLEENKEPDIIKAAVSALDYIQQNGHTLGWFKEPTTKRTAYSHCDESWLWDKSTRLPPPTHKKNKPKSTVRNSAQRVNEFYKINSAIKKFLETPQIDPLALLGCLQAVLITRCAVITRATLNACLVSIRRPVLAAHQWWYLDVTHHSGKNQRLELRRIFLDPVTASLAIRWHSQIAPLLTNIATTSQQKALSERAFRSFARAANLPREIRTTDTLQSAHAWLATTLPGFLMAFAARKRVTHSLPNTAWRRLLGLTPIQHEMTSSHSAYHNLDQLHPPISAITAFNRLLALIDATSHEALELSDTQTDSLTLPEKLLASWLLTRKINQHYAHKVVLLLGHRLEGALAELTPPYTIETLANIRSFMSEDIEQEEILALSGAFVDWLSQSAWSLPALSNEDDEDNPGVSANILSPIELQHLREHLTHPSADVADSQLRQILTTIIELGCLGMRRSEALKLRVMDLKVNTLSTNYSPIILIEPYQGRRLKSISSRRIVPANLLSTDTFSYLTKTQNCPADEMMISAYQSTTHSDQTIWLTANRVLQQYLQDPTLHLHHCRHTAATLFLLQLMAAPLGLHRYYGRCTFLDSLLITSEKTTRTLTNNNPCSLNHLRAISLLLGHLSPLITLKSYIHSCDLMLYFALDMSGETGYSKLLSLASGHPLETVKNHQELSQETRDHITQQTLPSLPQLTNDGFTLLRQVEKNHPEGVSREDTPLLRHQSQTSKGPTFDNITEVMSRISQHPTPDEKAALEKLLSPIKNHEKITIHTLRKGVMSDTAKDWVDRLHTTFNELPLEKLTEWKQGLLTILQEIDVHRCVIRIRSKKDIDIVIEVLKQMKFKVRDWQIKPVQNKGDPPQKFQPYRTWRDISRLKTPFQLRPAPSSNSFSYEGARWAILGHLLFSELHPPSHA